MNDGRRQPAPPRQLEQPLEATSPERTTARHTIRGMINLQFRQWVDAADPMDEGRDERTAWQPPHKT